MRKILFFSVFAMFLSIASFGQVGPIIGPDHICVGQTATYVDSSGTGLWSISPTSVATIGSTSGIVTGVSAGVATITYYRPGIGGTTRTITVNPVPTMSGPTIVYTGGTITLTGSPGGGTWGSSCPTILTVGATSGIVTGVGPGYCMVTYTLSTGCSTHRYIQDSTVGTVVDSILGPSSCCAGATVTLSNSTSGGTWSSSNTAIATINPTTGVLTGVSAGTVIITYTVGSSFATTTFTVLPGASISGPSTLCVGNSITLTGTPSGGSWSSGSTATATVSTGGVVTGIAPGTTNIYYNSGGCYAYHPVTVTTGPSAITGPTTTTVGGTVTLSDATPGGVWVSSNTSIAIIGSTTGVVTGISTGTCTISYYASGCITTITFTVGSSTSIAPITGASGTCVGSSTPLSDATPGGTWSSSNTAIATVTSSGVVTGVAVGSCTITYTVGSSYVTLAFTVTSSATISGPGSLCVGGTITLTSTPSGGTWTSGNTAVATVTSAGIVSGVGAGVVNIYYTVGGCYAYKSVTVSAVPTTITGTMSTTVGGTSTLSSTPSGGTWSSSNTSVATVNATTGVVTGVSVGYCIITYSIGGCYRTTTFYVTTSTTTISAITGPSYVCVGSTITLADSTPGGTWSSSNTSVATVSSTGVVTGVSAGTCTITYTVGSSYVTRTITVNAAPAPITGTTTTTVGGSVTLSDATTGGVWISSNTSIATITSAGVVTGVSAGTCTITYYLSGCYRTVTFTVTGTTTTISPITGPSTVCMGSTITLTDSTTGGTWSSSNTSVATINATSGVVTPVSAGTCTITYTVGSSYVTRSLTVTSGAYISGSSTLCVGSTITLTGGPTGGTWSTSSSSVATVSTAGVVTGVSAGTANIYYNAGGCYAYHTVTVNAAATISGSSTVCIGSTIALTATPGGGTWSSSSSSIATVSSAGVVTGVATGTVNITYTSGGCSATKTVSVNTSASITGSSTLCVGSTTTLTASPGGGTWTSSSTGVATVSSAGVVTGVSGGTATIYYSSGGCYAYKVVTVNTSASITGSSTVCVGSTISLTGTPGGGTWISSNTAVGTVSSTGTVAGISAGTTTIYYNAGGCYAYKVVSVNASPVISGSSTMCLGTTLTLTATPTGGTWSSSSTAIATVTSGGVVVGASAGVVNISYTVGGCSAIKTVTVNAGAAITGSSTVCVGSSITLTGTPSGGTWSTSSSSTATVSSTGVVTGVATGTVNIYYTSGGCYAYKVVSVTAAPAISGSSAVCVGSTITLTGSPSGGTWTTSSTSTATVSSAGVVTGIAGGVVNIYYTVGGCSAYKIVTVNASASISGGTSLCLGTTLSLTATPSGGTWTSSSTGVATVSSSGVVTAVSAGTATIYYVSGGCAAYRVVTVNSTASISGSSTVCAGATTTLTGTPSGGTWTSSSTAVASVSSTGVVTGMSAGVATITYNSGGCVATRTMTVNATGSISGPSTVCTGSTITLTGTPSGGTWASGYTAIATVGSSTGVVTGVTAGTMTVYYALGGCYAYRSMTVNVTPAPITGSSTVCVGNSITLSDATVGGTWSSSSTSIASVSSTGIVTGMSAGVANIYYVLGSCGVYKIVSVNPVPAPISGGTSVLIGSTLALSDAVTGGTWLSSNPSIATVNPTSGVVTGVATGSVVIYYTAGGCSVYTTITVGGMPSAHPGAASRENNTNTELPTGGILNVYPNPTSGNLNIQWQNQATGNAQVTVADMTGRTVYTNNIAIDAADGQAQISLPDLKDGIYLISIRSDVMYYSNKLTIQH